MFLVNLNLTHSNSCTPSDQLNLNLATKHVGLVQQLHIIQNQFSLHHYFFYTTKKELGPSQALPPLPSSGNV
jgi:hypothetical protein